MKSKLHILCPIALVTILFSSCLKDEAFKKEFTGFGPVQNNDDTAISDPETENMDSEMLSKAFELVHSDERFLMARSLLVYRNGKLVAETYPDNTDDINTIGNIQSCTKSITSLLTGIAVKKGAITSIDERLHSVYPQYFDADTRKQSITIKDALLMQTGLEFNNDKHTLELYQTEDNSAQFVLSQDYQYAPGTVMNYNDGAPQLISKLIEHKTGMVLSEFANQNLFEPLGITDWKWEPANDGSSFGAFSLYLKPRDFGKIGNLLLQNGKVNGTAIIDSSYLAEATKTQISANFNSEPYGYYFWILPALNAYYASGHGGQFLLVVPEKNLTAVYTAWPYTSHRFFDQANDLMSLIVQSCN